jgi:hypothetical protein
MHPPARSKPRGKGVGERREQRGVAAQVVKHRDGLPVFPRRSEVFRERVRVEYIALRVPVFDHVLVPGVQGGGTDRRALPVVVLGTVSSFPADGFVERGEPRFSEDLVLLSTGR